MPVLLNEAVAGLAVRAGGRYIDGTLGLGGHAEAILAAGGTVLGIDADPEALTLAGERLAPYGDHFRAERGNFREMEDIAARAGFAPVAGVLLDLGLSSLQLSERGRGFAFRWDRPLDMRMDPALPVSAADIVNGWDEEALANAIYRFGEERRSRAVARAIVRGRPVAGTAELARIVERAVGRAAGHIHPATRTFQGLRIAVNGELDALAAALRAAHDLLEAPGGRLAVISYHSLEDRIVKDFVRRESRDCVCPPEAPGCVCDHIATLRPVTRRAVVPAPEEIGANPRARSAKLRVAERL